tara:strand:- start:1443 stop:1895 length:453 start_codon:yes stop_codon:yes gene_type:complete
MPTRLRGADAIKKMREIHRVRNEIASICDPLFHIAFELGEISNWKEELRDGIKAIAEKIAKKSEIENFDNTMDRGQVDANKVMELLDLHAKGRNLLENYIQSRLENLGDLTDVGTSFKREFGSYSDQLKELYGITIPSYVFPLDKSLLTN